MKCDLCGGEATLHLCKGHEQYAQSAFDDTRAWAALWKRAAKEMREEAYEQETVKNNYTRALNAATEELHQMTRQSIRLDAERDALWAALERVEYCKSETHWGECPWCYHIAGKGHAPDCQRQAALGLTEEGVNNDTG